MSESMRGGVIGTTPRKMDLELLSERKGREPGPSNYAVIDKIASRNGVKKGAHFGTSKRSQQIERSPGPGSYSISSFDMFGMSDDRMGANTSRLHTKGSKSTM
jgi:hypothetical protein